MAGVTLDEFDQQAPLTVRRVMPEDWQAYRDYYKGLSKPSHFAGIMAGKDLDAPETYAALFDHTINTDSFMMFGLWRGDAMIGQSSICFLEDGKTALLAGSEIADAYRGQRLVDHFYSARMQYLKNIGFSGDIRTTIRPDNEPSQKAARRNGFEDTGVLDGHGYKIFKPR